MSYRQGPPAFVGVDWGKTHHQVAVIDGDGALRDERCVEHSVEGLEELTSWLARFVEGAGKQLPVAIETPHGPVVTALLEQDFEVFTINPKKLDRFRDRFTTAGAKDDRRDAWVLAQSLRTDEHAFRRVELEHPVVVELRSWTRTRSDLVEQRVALTHQIREELEHYYPQALAFRDDLHRSWFVEIWKLAPTPEAAHRLSQHAVSGVLRTHRIRKHTADEVLNSLRGKGFPVAPGVAQAACARIRIAAEQLLVVNEQLDRCHKEIERLTQQLAEALHGDEEAEEDEPGERNEQHDVAILRSLPGIGLINGAVLLAEAFPLLRHRQYHRLRKVTGAAPVTRRSGKAQVVMMRRSRNEQLGEALYHWARVAVATDHVWYARYAALRQRGHSHGRSLRTLGDRLLKVACTMLSNQQFYDPNKLQCPDTTKAAA